MKTRRWVTWLIFGICALAVLEGLGWVTWKALRLEGAESEARAQTAFQSRIRLALWRMESEITPIVAQEAARPYFHYQPFYAAERGAKVVLQFADGASTGTLFIENLCDAPEFILYVPDSTA